MDEKATRSLYIGIAIYIYISLSRDFLCLAYKLNGLQIIIESTVVVL